MVWAMTETLPVSRDRARRKRKDRKRPPETDGESTAPESEEGAPPPSRSRWGTAVFAAITLLFIAGLASLVWEGYRSAEDITGGNEVHDVNDPAAPGYQAAVVPTPVDLFVMLKPDGTLGDILLLAEGAGGLGGGVVVVPGVTVIESVAGPLSLGEVFEISGLDGVRNSVTQMIGAGVTGFAAVSPDEMRAVLEPAGLLTIDNPDRIGIDDGSGNRETVFEAGELQLAAEEAVTYMNTVGSGEDEINRASRAQAVWESWLATVAAEGESTLPPDLQLGEGDSSVEIRERIDGLAAGFVSFEQLPLERIPVPGTDLFAVYRPLEDAIAEMTLRVIPFPSSAFPGQRARVRLLNGTRDATRALKAARPVVGAGGEITALGNAEEFGQEATVVEFYDVGHSETADAIAEALGVRATFEPQSNDGFEVTVIVGSDYSG